MEVSHSYAHLEPNTPLSSSSTVLSLFCSSFSRSLASASSCQWKTDSYYIITVHTVAPHWLDLWISASTGVGVSAGWGEGGRRQAQRSNLPRWWPPPRSACHLCRATFWIQMGGSPPRAATMTARRIMRHGVIKEAAGWWSLGRERFFVHHYTSYSRESVLSGSLNIVSPGNHRQSHLLS